MAIVGAVVIPKVLWGKQISTPFLMRFLQETLIYQRQTDCLATDEAALTLMPLAVFPGCLCVWILLEIYFVTIQECKFL